MYRRTQKPIKKRSNASRFQQGKIGLVSIFLLTTVCLTVCYLSWKVFGPLELTAPHKNSNLSGIKAVVSSDQVKMGKPLENGIDLLIEPSPHAYGVSLQLVNAGIMVSPTLFIWTARLSGLDKKIKAGGYEIQPGISLWQILLKLGRGEVSQKEILLGEGWNFRQIKAALLAHPDIKHTINVLSDQEILAALEAKEIALEGLFHPDTYLFPKGSTDLHILQRSYRAQQQILDKVWAQRAKDLPLNTPYELLILASIIEKETGKPIDRENIAGVFINRLRLGMLLQTDPTVIYGLGLEFDGNLRKRDLLNDTPYNTYTRVGLPPTPIAIPGRAALMAAAHPSSHDYLYFVAKGDGSSFFSRNLAEHNTAVNLYQRQRSIRALPVNSSVRLN